MKILSAPQLKAGAKGYNNAMGAFVQPLNFIPAADKDDDWIAMSMDFLDFQGLKQIRRNSPRLLKYCKAAKGIIDKSDYIPDEDNDNREVIEKLEDGVQEKKMLDLQFYPIIPTIIDSFRTEFSKRQSKLIFTTTDRQSLSEIEIDKTSDIEQLLVQDAEYRVFQKLQAMGADMESEEAQQQLQPDVIKQLPQIQNFYKTSYRNMYAEWAQHMKAVDDERFHMNELEDYAFTDSLTVDREFWHLKMKENDYEVELWNPLLTAYHKSPGRRWMSTASWIVNYDAMTVPDAVDKFGWMMNEEQLSSLEELYPVRAAGYLLNVPNDGSYYDNTKTYEQNTQGPSLAMRQAMSHTEMTYNGGDVVLQTLLQGEDLQNSQTTDYLRVSTIYFKTQRKYGHLTKIVPGVPYPVGSMIDETYKVVDKPIYDTTTYKEKTKRNLVFGEHIDWFWANEVWGGIKIGPNKPSWAGMNKDSGCQPLYIGLNGGKPGRVPFQFKGDDNIWDVKLPVEGAVFSDRNTISVPMVARLFPYQVGFNYVNNQIADLIIDEAGSVLFIDQNTIPKHSMGEDWGDGNYAKFWATIKNYGVALQDHSMSNIQGTGQFNQNHVADLSQTQRLLGRIQIAEYYKRQAFESIGFNAQRLGQEVSQDQTAKGYEEALNKSYDQTEMYFTQHCDYLMPRVHQMRTELAQYYNSTNPSVILQYATDSNMQEIFRMDGTKLLLRDINVRGITKINARQILAQVKQKMIADNTTGASPADFTRILKSDNLAELDKVVNLIEARNQENNNAQREQEDQHHKEELEQEAMLKAKEWERDDLNAEKERQKDILVAQIQAASKAATAKTPQMGIDAYQEEMDNIQNQTNFREEMDLKKEVHYTKTDLEKQKLAIRDREVSASNRRTSEMMIDNKASAAKKQKEKSKK